MRVDQQRCPDAWVLGSETLLSRMVDNMVENAVKHNERGVGCRYKPPLTVQLYAWSSRTVERCFNLKTSAS